MNGIIYSKSFIKSDGFDRNAKREGIFSTDNKSFDSWNKAKDKLFANEYINHRRMKAYTNCGEVRNKFS